MKRHQLFLGSFVVILSSCETGPINTGGSFDPLSAPGSGRTAPVVDLRHQAGSFVSTSMEAAFFSNRPRGDADADKQIPANTQMKVISDDGTYVKVELDSGEVGFVPSVLVNDQRGGTAPTEISPDAYQIYPPLQGVGGFPTDDSIPTIPPVIDPEAPVIDPEEIPVIPDVPSIPLEEPTVPEPAPLPPGIEGE